MSKNLEVEICCGSYYDTLQAWKGGAKRVELNSALHLGGLTPSLGTLRQVKKNTGLKVICMVRPRGAGFCYNLEEFEVMLEDAHILLENGADGIAFGCLTADRKINEKQTKKMVQLIKSYNKESVFHRAFDCVTDINEAMQTLIEIGVDRVLTSGLKSTAIAGAETIQYLQKEYGEQIEILAGSGLNAQNVQDLIRKTNVKQIHSSCKGWLPDMTTCSEDVSFSYRAKEKDACREAIVGDYEVVDVVLVRKFINMVTCELTFEIEKEDEKELKICYDNTALPEK